MKKRILAFIMLFVFSFSFVGMAETSQNNKKELLRYILFQAKEHSKEGVDDVDLFLNTLMRFAGENDQDFEQVLTYLTQSIDEYGDYFPPSSVENLQADLSGVSGGIGAMVEMKNGKITVVNVLPGSPAEKAGVQTGYAIISINDIDLTGMSLYEGLEYVRGEVGSEIIITFEVALEQTVTLTLTRDKIDIASVNHSILEENKEIGYINISSFSDTTGEEFAKAIVDLKEKGIEKIIIDLRYNGGGTLGGAIEVCDSLLEKDQTIVSIEPKKLEETEVYKASGSIYKGEIVVLVNEYSASASEVVTGALKDNKRATIVGTKTYGKGTVQTLNPLPIYGGVYKFTTAFYLTPNGTSLNKIGITPDITVENESYKMTEEEIPLFKFERKLSLNDSGKDVLALKNALKLLRYNLNEDNVFDYDTYNSIKDFQKASSLYAYGVCDFTTQQYIKQALLDATFYNDTQLLEAINFLKG